ncbi:DNA polymerase-1 [Diaminobutyricimonas aerilata]|uniref:DNA-directed DNA polymerase n=1 Tax=Diaminobutyricimonas aerilata TaxID=1162967 RepID=A0A2M9CJI4_9MICO|nr:bifunctional 3'-5' exonuclease/DNA polymerase [Diaminobutyricimonas aerilata]PJJ72071.1 DNA polymerase-1 [Diaminobutyricimonas aerilata]
MYIVLERRPDGGVLAHHTDDGGRVTTTDAVREGDLATYVSSREPGDTRWVWHDTAAWYPRLLAAGVRVERCHDLRLAHVILRSSLFTAHTSIAAAPSSGWDRLAGAAAVDLDALFDVEQRDDLDPVAEFALQREAVTGSDARIGRLVNAESAGALVAAEMTHAGLPWRADAHDALLAAALGPRPRHGERPAELERLADEVRRALDAPDLNPDSPPELVRALRRAGITVDSTRSHELKRIEHPVIPPLLEFKKLARLHTANGWHWLDTWVRDGRFRPVYVPGGVVTGRWASNGGGALQLPAQVRSAVIADPGWKLVVADAAQLEPRVLAGMSADTAMATAARASDLYQAMVDSGAVQTREQAKYGILGAIYGGTRGESGRMLPRITRAYPRAMALVEDAARAGERGERVRTWLGRTSPLPGEAMVTSTDEPDAVDRAAQGRARAWGRFTRNFVVQGTAAEWALHWMATLRIRLWELGDGRLEERPHLAFFLHDEVVVHTPEASAERVAETIRECAAEAGRLLFGSFPIEFPLSVAIVDDYGQAK